MSEGEITSNMETAMNCQKKTYQFNNATLNLRQVIGQVKYKTSFKLIFIISNCIQKRFH